MSRNVPVLALAAVAALVLAPMGAAQTPTSLVVPFQPFVNLYEEDFELGDGGYTTGGSASWQYGSPVSPPDVLPGQGPNMWGTNLASDYGNNECGYLQSAAIDLSGQTSMPATGVSTARLLFRHWMHVELRFDAGLVMGSSNGVDWAILTPVGGYPNTVLSAAQACFGIDATGKAYTTSSTAPEPDAWALAEFDVTGYLGGDLHVRWVFATDISVVKRGWYIDDVVVQAGAGAEVPLPSAPSSIPFTPASNVYTEDFELDDGGWSANGTGVWEWGEPVSPPLPLLGSLSMWGTRIAGNYLPNECGNLTSPAIAIPGANPGAGVQAARLSFKLWRHTENSYDGAHLLVSADGGSWVRLNPSPGYDKALLTAGARACLGVDTIQTVWTGPASAPAADGWIDVTADLTPYMGKSVQLRFGFGSEADGEFPGVYVDDFLVQVGAGAAVPGPGTGSVPCTAAPGWTVAGANPSWCWGPATTGPASAVPVWGTNLHGQYNPSECSTITSPPVNTAAIPGAGLLTLRWEHFVDTASTDDGGVVQVSTDGIAWTTVTPVGGYSTSNLGTNARACVAPGQAVQPGFASNPTTGYQLREVKLSSYQGSTIQVRFTFGSGPSTQDFGWYVRGVQLTRGAGFVPLTAEGGEGALPALLSKADPDLLDWAAKGGQGLGTVIVTGPPHLGLREDMFASRAEAGEHVAKLAEPFFAMVERVALKHGAQVRASYALAPAVTLEAPLAAAEALAGEPLVRWMTLDAPDKVKLIEPELAPDDTVGAMNSEGRKMVQAEDIWALGFRGEGVKIAIVDTGIDPTHEALKHADGSTRIVKWRDYVNPATTVPYDDHGHGTHVAGTSAGSDDYTDPVNGKFTEVGVAPKAILMGYKFLNSAGSGSFDNGMKALNDSFFDGATLTSNSWGHDTCSISIPMLAMVRTTTNLGLLNVFAAGNNGPSGTVGNPACSESALSVGAVDKNGVIASFSSRGPCSDPDVGSGARICPDVVAKGYLVKSSVPRGSCSMCHSSGLRVANGTSMATPHVAGAAALSEQMKVFYTGSGWDTASRAEEQVFKMTALDLGAPGEDNTYGWGLPQLLNIYALLNATDDANIVSTFSISKDPVRLGESTTLTFTVKNLGGASASGAFEASLTDPNGGVQVLKSTTPALGLLDGEGSVTVFTVAGATVPGTYTFEGSFDYSYVDGNNDVQYGLVQHSGTFDVKRVFVSVDVQGLAAQTLPGNPQFVAVNATNTGNEPAQATVLEFTVPDDYVFLPGANFDPARPNSRYADPEPSQVIVDANFQRVTLVFNVGNLSEGDSFVFTTNLVPTIPGNYKVLTVAKWKDGSGKSFSQGSLRVQSVGAPPVQAEEACAVAAFSAPVPRCARPW